MERIPRADWIDSCEQTNHAIEAGLRLVDGESRRVLRIDFAPLDDMLEVDVQSDGRTVRLLIDHPRELLMDDRAARRDQTSYLVASGDIGTIEIHAERSLPITGSPTVAMPTAMPTAMEGAYYEG